MLTNKYTYILILLITLNYFSCNYQRVKYNSDLSYNSEFYKDTIGQLERKTLKLARKVCGDITILDFCSDGYNPSYSYYPSIVKLNKNDISESFDTIYVLYIFNHLVDSLLKEGMTQYAWVMDSLLNVYSQNNPNNRVCFTPSKKHLKGIRKFNRKHGLKNKGKEYCFTTFTLDFNCVYGGRTKVLTPTPNEYYKVKFKFAEIYYITFIHDVY